MSVDKHRIPAENLIPVLRNPSIYSLTVTQQFAVEDRKLQKLMEEINPQILQASLSQDDLMDINRSCYAW